MIIRTVVVGFVVLGITAFVLIPPPDTALLIGGALLGLGIYHFGMARRWGTDVFRRSVSLSGRYGTAWWLWLGEREITRLFRAIGAVIIAGGLAGLLRWFGK